MNDVPQKRRSIIVIGGGISGLSAAWRLQQISQKSGAPVDLQLLEGSSLIGGSLQSTARDGFLLEAGPDCFISEKPRGIGLCRELGLDGDLIGTRPEYRRSFILRDGRFHPVPEGFYLMGPSRYRPFLESRLLSWPGKFRAMLEPLIPSRPPSDESLGSFVRRRFGQEMLDWMAQPLIAGIYGASPEALSLRATFPQFLDMERTYGSIVLGLKMRKGGVRAASGARYGLFVTLRGGMQTLADTIKSKLGSVVVRIDTKVVSIAKSSGDAIRNSWQVRLANGEVLTADAVCLALPSYAAAQLLRGLDTDLASDLAGIAYAPAATLNVALRNPDVRRPMNGVGFVVPHKEKRLVLGCTIAQHKFAGRAPEGFTLLRAFLGGVQGSNWTGLSDADLTENVWKDLQGWLGLAGRPLFTQLQRYSQALPQYNVGHLQRILRVEERALRYSGLALAGNWQYGIGIPDCIESGERAADAVVTYLERPAPAVL
jgi:oxygen-dependent protoporphyrinogen oxidase